MVCKCRSSFVQVFRSLTEAAQIEANHAGGYQYRLAKKSANLTEAEFQKMPLAFVGKQGLRWDGGPEHGGTEIFFEGVYATEGTLPKGSAWAMNPIPLPASKYGLPNVGRDGPIAPLTPVFTPHCNDTRMCSDMGDGGVGGNIANRLEIVDSVRIPAGLAPGDYVLGWRWGAPSCHAQEMLRGFVSP